MANNKTGFDYYNIDTNRYQDIKIKRLKKDFGTSGIAVYDYILCEIYRVRGCFLAWDECTAFDVADYFGLKESLVNEIVNYCGVVGLFDKALLTSGSIISSRSIQQRFIEMSTRAKRKDFKIPEEIDIITEECKIIPEQSGIITEVSAKVKESKRERIPPIIPHDELKHVIDISETKNLLLSDNQWKWKEQMCRQSGLSIKFIDMLPEQIDNFLSWIQVIGEEGTILKIEDAKRRFYYWWRDIGHKEWKLLNSIEDDKRRTSTFKSVASNPAGNFVRSEVKAATDMQSGGTTQEDYSARF